MVLQEPSLDLCYDQYSYSETRADAMNSRFKRKKSK